MAMEAVAGKALSTLAKRLRDAEGLSAMLDSKSFARCATAGCSDVARGSWSVDDGRKAPAEATMKPAPALASARTCEPGRKSVVGLGMASREEERTRLGSALDCDAHSVGGEEEMFASAMGVTPMLAWSPAVASDSESKSVVGLRSVRYERARERLGMATETRDPMAGPAAEAMKRRLTATLMLRSASALMVGS